eukprot:gb/GFBE01024565.1/.p1 GENE.gb/GFBE01024565.1/~~gb/GFBE01024565.1/.p1  ORF type:complete len:433 (+),score=79.29 gb/GFBE01024565.1/:1-1299(+)
MLGPRRVFGLILCVAHLCRASHLSCSAPLNGDAVSGNYSCLLQRASSKRTSASQRQNRAVRHDALLQGASREVKCADMQIMLPPSPKMQPLENIRWVHFPKAGTSFIATIWNYACGQGDIPLDLSVSQNYAPNCGACYDFALMDRYPSPTYCSPGVLSSSFVTQHQPVSMDVITASGLKVVGFFRKPSQRLISAFHNSLHASGFTSTEVSALNAECGVAGPGCFAKYPGIAGCTARMLTGGNCAEAESARDQPFDGGEARLEEALVTLKAMVFVGITERWDESVCLFHRMFGGRLNAAQLVDMHQGTNHEDNSYDESVLDGFVDEVDEQIYKAAEQRFNELLAEHLGSNASSACGGILLQSDSEDDTAKTCSCEAQQRECGVATEHAIDCGQCPKSRLQYTDNSAANLTCEQQTGVCLVDGSPNHDIFAWPS